LKIIVVSTPVFTVGSGGLAEIAGTSGYSGLEVIAWLTAKGLAERGHQVSLVAPNGSECPGVEIIPCGPAQTWDEAIAYGGDGKKDGYGGYWQHLLKLNDGGCVLDHSWQKRSALLKMEGRLKCPILGVTHAPIDTMYQKLPPEKVISFVCISEDQRNHFETLFNRPARVCLNGVDGEGMYGPLGVPRSDRFLFLARFSTIKGPDLAIEACLKAGVGLDLIGDTSITNEPDFLRKCMAMAEQESSSWDKDKGRQIRLIGPVSRGNAVWWFSQAYCLLHPNQRFCHLPRQKIVTARGVVPIDDIGLSDKVLAHDGNFHDVSAVISRHYIGRICAIKHSSFNGDLMVTPDHPLYSVKPHVLAEYASGKSRAAIAEDLGMAETTAYYWTRGLTACPEWNDAADIKIGDLLVTPVPANVDRSSIATVIEDGLMLEIVIQLTDEFLTLCGWYLAEGFENNGYVRFALNSKETEHAAEIRRCLKSAFNSRSFIYFARDSRCQVIISSNKVGRIMKGLFGGKATVKRMPQWMLLLPPEKLRHVIRSMWRGDGCKVKGGKYEYLSYTTASPSLAMQLWLSLAKFGIISYLVEKKASPKTKNAGRIMYNLNVRGDSAKKLAGIVGWDFKDGREKSAWKGKSYIHHGLIYSRVNGISEIDYDGKVCNMTVPGVNSYVAQLVASHNCEPFGLSPVESMLCGNPVIAWNFGAMRETVLDKQTGFLVSSLDEMIELIRSRAVESIDRGKCREWALQFSVDRMVRRYEELAMEALATGGW